jgi:hypothetical protein
MQRDGVAPPQVLSSQPRLPVSLVMYLEAFYELDTERSIGPGVMGRIPWSKIILYGEHYGFDLDELVFFIRKMDDAFITAQSGGGSGGSSSTRETVQRPPRPD